MQGLPRHLGQHTGGIVIAAGRLDEVVPIEPAAMPGRRVVQWDKDDCADLGIIKIDLLGLGMLDALEEALPLVREHEGVTLDLAHLPPDDPETYAMIRRADTVGVFQIESRAQMATLPRMKPERFYDLVVEVAIIRPGPIVGQMVHPYLERRAGREPVTYPAPLARADPRAHARRAALPGAAAAHRHDGGGLHGRRGRGAAPRHGLQALAGQDAALSKRAARRHARARHHGRRAGRDRARDRSFALYGFPESHSASFALIAYASAYLKRHHPAAFLAGLLNAWPMGFYAPATLVKDAQRHGVEVRPIDVARSGWKCTLEPASRASAPDPGGPRPRPPCAWACATRTACASRRRAALAAQRARRPFADLADLVRRVALRRGELDALAELGALAAVDPARAHAAARRSGRWPGSSAIRTRSSPASRRRAASLPSPR